MSEMLRAGVIEATAKGVVPQGNDGLLPGNDLDLTMSCAFTVLYFHQRGTLLFLCRLSKVPHSTISVGSLVGL